MAKQTGDSESDLPQKRGRFENPGTPHRLEMPSFEAEAPIADRMMRIAYFQNGNT